jgi:hypothetical protein
LIELLLCRPTLLLKNAGSRQLPLSGRRRRLVLIDDRLRGRAIRLAGHHQALVDRDDVDGLVEISLRLVSLRQKRRRIHLSDDLPLLYEIALVREYLRQPASDLGRHIDLGSLQSAIAAGETRSDRFGLKPIPDQSAGRRHHGQGNRAENDFALLAYGGRFFGSGGLGEPLFASRGALASATAAWSACAALSATPIL